MENNKEATHNAINEHNNHADHPEIKGNLANKEPPVEQSKKKPKKSEEATEHSLNTDENDSSHQHENNQESKDNFDENVENSGQSKETTGEKTVNNKEENKNVKRRETENKRSKRSNLHGREVISEQEQREGSDNDKDNKRQKWNMLSHEEQKKRKEERRKLRKKLMKIVMKEYKKQLRKNRMGAHGEMAMNDQPMIDPESVHLEGCHWVIGGKGEFLNKKVGEKKKKTNKKKKKKSKVDNEQRQPCNTTVQCQPGECCSPRVTTKQRYCVNFSTKNGKQCIDSCACADGLFCYVDKYEDTTNQAATTEAAVQQPSSSSKKKKKKAKKQKQAPRTGKCKAPESDDLLTGEYLAIFP